MASCAHCGAVLSGAEPCGCARAIAPALEEEVIALFDQVRRKLMRYLLSLGLPPADAEEIVQEVFLALFRHLQQGKSRSNLRAWVFQVAHNLGLKQRARSRRQRSAPEPHPSDDLVDGSPNPEDQAAGNQRRARLLNVLSALPDQDRRCLTLRAEGLKYREIAEVLGISLGAVALSMERSLKRFAGADRG